MFTVLGTPSLTACFVHVVVLWPPVHQVELDQEKGLEMRKWVLSGILASEEAYLGHLEALLIVSVTPGSRRPMRSLC